jgi:hypothetical protein
MMQNSFLIEENLEVNVASGFVSELPDKLVETASYSGYFKQGSRAYPMEFILFELFYNKEGRLALEVLGEDMAGKFTISSLSEESLEKNREQSHKIKFEKIYPTHSIFYEGQVDSNLV